MSEFNQPQYQSYVELCRAMRYEDGDWLGLAHQYKKGDWFIYHDGREWHGPGMVLDPTWLQGRDTVWLPTLSDWLDMIQAEGASGLVVWKRTEGWDCKPVNGPMIDYDLASFDTPTPEEAVARLWMVYRLHERDSESTPSS